MTVRSLPARAAKLNHALVTAPDGSDLAPDGPVAVGKPSSWSVKAIELKAARAAQTMLVSRRETGGATRSSRQHENVRLADRVDPFWEIDWQDQFSGGRWRRVSSTRYQLTTDARGNLVYKAFREFSPVALKASESYTPTMVKVVALLVQFGGLSTLQLCSFLDTSPKAIAVPMNRLYAAGVVERMTPSWARGEVKSGARPGGGSGDIWRLNLKSDALGSWLDGLSPLESALVTGGRSADSLLQEGTTLSEHTLRHNLAVGELALRALETMPGIAGVWGEPLVQGDRFLSETVRSALNMRYVRGDAAVVTKNGGVIVVELTALKDTTGHHGKTLAPRAAAWGAIAHLSDIPMSVVFVSIGGFTASRRIAKSLRDGLEEEMGKYFANVNDRATACDAVSVVSAQAWWPSAGAVSRKFLTMEAMSPLTGEYRELAPHNATWDARQPVVTNTVAALHQPEWILRPVRELDDKTVAPS